ncbi:cell division protein ZapE [Marinobacter sp. X15-166B]|uniref:cell division protein ZapE n=1 Tax=Marinobacter sp. X15-166B TaxID=1897620 RepID=UPI00085CDE21|nr:cell division protein ZapE [Marinobacter sp. X15-166B]OEY67298.1 cell division protein ZapE [Marinobacter sp. X15-166B]
MTDLSPYAAYQHALATGFKPDAAQRTAAEYLDRCYQQLDAGEPRIAGVYLWGPVGRGKTWLMDRFHQSLTVPARRMHFHHFMRWLHRRLFQLSGQQNPLDVLARELAAEVRVLCFDELYINDIGDVVLLSGVLQPLFEHGLVLVTTSNQHPDELYAQGFNRERLLPTIGAIKEYMEVLSVDGGQDHRQHPGQKFQRYWVNQPEALHSVFTGLLEQLGEEETGAPLILGHRAIRVTRRSERVLWCRYDDLCEQPLAAADFIELCDQFSHVLLSAVPRLTDAGPQSPIARGTEDGVFQVAAGDRQLPRLSRLDDGVRRFIALVDECYDRGVPVYLDAAVPLNELYEEGALAFPFRRTLSRLQEMQLDRFAKNNPPKHN